MSAVWKEAAGAACELMSKAAGAGAKVSERRSPPPSTFQCAFYSPARRGHPHPVSVTY